VHTYWFFFQQEWKAVQGEQGDVQNTTTPKKRKKRKNEKTKKLERVSQWCRLKGENRVALNNKQLKE